MVVPAEYLVNYGRTAFLGRFVNCAGVAFVRDERVVVQSQRGLETGTVLQDTAPPFAHLVGIPTGDLLRRFNADDALREVENARKASDLLHEAQTAADSLGLPLVILDAEIPLDAKSVFIHILPFAEVDLQPLAELLSSRHHLPVSFVDSRHSSAKESGGCGKPDCGSKSGSCGDCGNGCSSGSCSKGKVNSAEELSAYFVQLRQKMELEFGRVPLRV